MSDQSNQPIKDETRITARLIDLICDMTITQQLDLLSQLDRKKYKGSRADYRRQRKIAVDYEVNNRVQRDFIRDISNVGVFIETNSPPAVGETITLSFSLSEDKDPVKVTGRVIRSAADGFAVDFRRKARE